MFAVEDTSAQLTWSAMSAARCVVGVGGRSAVVTANPPAWLHQQGLPSRPLSRLPGGPGSVVIAGLDPGITYDVWVAAMPPETGRSEGGQFEAGEPGADPSGAERSGKAFEVPVAARRRVGRLTTLRPPPGQLLTRFASVSDLHVGERSFGVGGRLRQGPELGGPSALLCLRSAVAEATAWGAELIAARGDLTRNSRAEQFDLAARTLTGTGLPAVGVLGNHDVRYRANGVALSRPGGLVVTDDVSFCDLPGIRLVLAHSPLVTNHRGDLPAARMARIAELCAGAAPTNGRPGMAAVILHHPLSPHGRALSPYPPGVPKKQSMHFAALLRAANPRTLVLAGHRHRNRRLEVGGITVAEVGSTKDYPGSWAGYAVYEGGLRQVVRRIAAPAALAWTEATGRSLAGQWARWAPGRLTDRCWVTAW